MASENETVEEVLREINSSHEGMIAFEFMSYADRIEVAYRREVAELQRRLKVAEDALGESKVAVCTICDQKHMCGLGTDKFDPCCIYKDIDNALAAIREEGGAE